MIFTNKLTPFFGILLTINLGAQATWIHPDSENNYSYVYAPGVFSSETQLAKYCPDFTASTGEKVTCKIGIQTIQGNVSACNFAEINLKTADANTQLLKRVGCTALGLSCLFYLKHKIYEPHNALFACASLPMLLGYTFWPQFNFAVTHSANKKYGVILQNSTKQEHKESVSSHYLDLFNMNIGQDTDITICKTKVDEHLNKQPTDKQNKVILYGVSRGSATVLNYFARHNDKHIAAVVCEGIFDSIPNISNHGNLLARLKNIILNLNITAFRSNGACPLTCIDEMTTDQLIAAKDKPIALITSKVDKNVPAQCTMNVYKTLKTKGFTNVHILQLKSSSHSVYPLDSEKERYQNFMHAFYKHYQLPHIEAYATQGEADFAHSSPAPEAI